MPNTKPYLDRPPRIQPELPIGEETIPPPPKSEENSQPLWQTAVPVITIVGYMFVSVSGRGSPLFVLPMLIAVGASTGIAIHNWLKNRQESEDRQRRYEERLIELRREMVDAHNRQRTFYENNYPKPDQVIAIRGDDQANRSGSRLWERRTSDHDFGYVRVGIGTRDSIFTYKIAEQSENDENSQIDLAEQLENDSKYVTEAPITLPLYQHLVDEALSEDEKKEQLIHSNIGIAYNKNTSAEEIDVYNFVQSLLVHYTAFHSPIDTQLFIVGSEVSEDKNIERRANEWEWAYMLPQTFVSPYQRRVYIEDSEIIASPVNGKVDKIYDDATDRNNVMKVGDPIMDVVSDDGKNETHTLRAKTVGRIQLLVKENQNILVGKMVARSNIFDLSKQQLLDEQAEDHSHYKGQKKKPEVAGVRRYWREQVWAELDRRARHLREREESSNINISLPFMLIVVDMLDITRDRPDADYESWLNEVESEAALSLILSQGKQLGVSIIFLVSDRKKVPSGCEAVIELTKDMEDNLRLLYAEVGLNTQRYVGIADSLEVAVAKRGIEKASQESQAIPKLVEFASHLDEWEVRREYGADLPPVVGLLGLYDADSIPGLQLDEKWETSIKPDWAGWPKVPIAKLAGNVNRDLHFFADVDGVHGMIAGSTGSGKSELLMTLILSLAISYDPSVVNFVLVDFKGGAAFDPFKNLPHVVDIVTNLTGNAVERMFAAINAELNRRQAINQRYGVKDIVDYRRKGYHTAEKQKDLEEKDYYPHLFIIIDEFAEMIANNPEYKAQLDSITRLGRALGVSLILAAQRPSGVTDQMRANIKFRICLRVETKEESSELLRLPDAAYLPSIPGRGYLQVGNESLENIQVSYTGYTYSQQYEDPDYNELERFKDMQIIWEHDVAQAEKEGVFEVLVRRMDQFTEQKYPIKESISIENGRERLWRKPWPSILPEKLTLISPVGIEIEHILNADLKSVGWDGGVNEKFVLSPAVKKWLEAEVILNEDAAPGHEEYKINMGWNDADWKKQENLLLVNIGLIDNPSRAKSRLLQMNITRNHYAILGGAQWGKTTALTTAVIAMSAALSPNDLHFHLLDFGTRGLSPLRGLPHAGAYINVHEREKFDRLIRVLEEEVDERSGLRTGEVDTDDASGTAVQEESANIFQYNRRMAESDPDKQKPLIVVVIDNFAELKNTYETYEDRMMRLLRNGRANGVYFLVSANQLSDIGKYLSLFPESMALKLSSDDYSDVVGRTSLKVAEIAGRGLRKIEKEALEIQVALPMGYLSAEEWDGSEEDTSLINDYIRNLSIATPLVRGEGVAKIEKLGDKVFLDDMNTLFEELQQTKHKKFKYPKDGYLAVIGQEDNYLHPFILDTQSNPHLFVVGGPRSGKTTLLRTIILSLAEQYPPDQVAMVFIDYEEGLPFYGGKQLLDNLPHHIGDNITTDTQLFELFRHLEAEHMDSDLSVNDQSNGSDSDNTMPKRDVYIFIDNFYSFNEAISDREFPDEQSFNLKNFSKSLANIARRGRNLHFIISGVGQDIEASNSLVKYMMSTRYGIATDKNSLDGRPFYGDANKFKNMEIYKGRGFVVEPGNTQVVQFAQPYQKEANMQDELDDRITKIQQHWEDKGKDKATWIKELLPYVPETDIRGVSPRGSSVDYDTKSPRKLKAGVRDCMIEKILKNFEVETLQELEDVHMITITNDMDDVALKESYGTMVDFSECFPEEETAPKADSKSETP